MSDFINDVKIQNILEENKNHPIIKVLELIEKAKKLKGLTPEDAAVLLQCEDKKATELMFKTARWIKEEIYGNRLVLFAPLYVTNICSNNCLYCGFRKDNKKLIRKKLTMNEIRNEVRALIKQGHKRVLLVAGEDNEAASIDYVEDAIKTVYNTKVANGEIRRVNINVAPLSKENFKRIKNAGIGTYQLFQETYHKETYKKMHPDGLKSNYELRLQAIDMAQEAGIDDVGIGVLFGLYDYKFDVLGLLYHSIHLEKKYGIGPHTISFPRVKPALNAPMANNIPYPVSDEDFKKIVAIIRMAVPYTGMILSTREPKLLRDEIFELGISQISAGSRTNPGAYTGTKEHVPDSEQFSIEDTRTQKEVIRDILKKGFLPSFCTACYRVGRTGKDFMDLAKPGDIKNFCLPNCILTFKEYTEDYADKHLKKIGENIIEQEVQKISNKNIREKTREKIKKIENGERDLFF